MATENLLAHLLLQEQANNKNAASKLRRLVSVFIDSLTKDSVNTQMQIFSDAGGPLALIELVGSPSRSISETAYKAVLKISYNLVRFFPGAKISADIFLEFLSLTEDESRSHENFQRCRNNMVSFLKDHCADCWVPSIKHLCEKVLGDLVSGFLDELMNARNTDIKVLKLGYDMHAIVEFAKRIRELGSVTVDKEIDKLIQTAEMWFELILEDCQNEICWTFFLLLSLLYRTTQHSNTVREKLSALYNRRHTELNMAIQEYSKQGCSCHEYQRHLELGLFCDRSFLTRESREIITVSLLKDTIFVKESHFIINRDRVVENSLEKLANLDANTAVSIEFASEVATGPGVLREWLSLMCKELFNPKFGLFTSCPADKTRFFPNHGSGINPCHLAYFNLCGQVIALALTNQVKVDVKLARFFFKELTKREITWEDVKDVDPELYESCKKILEMDAQTLISLGLTFEIEVHINGRLENIMLCPGGREIQVNIDNRLEYLNLHMRKRFVDIVAEQIKAFGDGFSDVLPYSVLVGKLAISTVLDPLELEDLDMILFGRDRTICVLEWKLHTEYIGYTSYDEEIQWFWQVVESMNDEQRRKLLFFFTSIEYLPSKGFSRLPNKFKICMGSADHNRLPTANTCFYKLTLPRYLSYEMLHNRLYAITKDYLVNGFGLA